MCLTYSRMQRVTSTAVHMRNAEAHSRRLLREAMNEQDTYPGHLHHCSTCFLHLKVIIQEENRNAERASRMPVPAAVLGVTSRQAEAGSPVKGEGVEPSAGGRPPAVPALPTTGGSGQLRGGKDSESLDASIPALSSNLATRGG